MQEELFHTFEYLKNQGHQIVLHPMFYKDIEGLMERLSSRFQSGMIADLQAPDMETVLAIIEQNLAEWMPIFHQMLRNLLLKTSRKREGSGGESEQNHWICKSATYTNNAESSKTRTSAHLSRKGCRSPSSENVINSVSSTYNIEQAQLLYRSRKAAFSLPRQVTMYILKEQ